MSDNDLLLGQPLHHTQALELVCAAEKCDMWAEIRADEDGTIRFYTDEPEQIGMSWWGYENNPRGAAGTIIGSLQMFGEELDWKTWGIRQSDWRWMFPDPQSERDFRGYMRRMMGWARVVRCFEEMGEMVLVAGVAWDSENELFVHRSEAVPDGWADQLKMNEFEGWQTWKMEL